MTNEGMTWTLLATCCYAGYVFCRARQRRDERAERRAESYRAEARAFEAGYEEGCKPVQSARDASARVFELYDSEALAGEALALQLAAALAAVAACERQLLLRGDCSCACARETDAAPEKPRAPAVPAVG